MYAKEVSKRPRVNSLISPAISRHQKNLMRAITIDFDWRMFGANSQLRVM
jgi:hypothetical protein